LVFSFAARIAQLGILQCITLTVTMGTTEDIETSAQPAAGRSTSRQDGSLKGVEVSVGRENLSSVVPPDDKYEGRHRWDAAAEWTVEEEKAVRWKTDIRLMSWLCVMFFALQLDRGNLSNALADDFLDDMGFTSDIYNNGTTIQLVAFLSAEFPAQYLAKRYGFRIIMPSMMFAWGAVTAFQAFMNDMASFYITRALIGFFEGGFIPAAVSSVVFWSVKVWLTIECRRSCMPRTSTRPRSWRCDWLSSGAR